MSPPAFAAVVGKSRAYTPEEGVKYLSIRPERIREVDGESRDYWVLETAKSTLLRIEAVEEGLKMSEPSMNGLMKLGYSDILADGVVRASEFYKDIDVQRFRNTVTEALKTLVPEARLKREREESPAPARPRKEKPEEMKEPESKEDEMHEVSVGADEEDTVLKIIDSLSSGSRGAPWDKVVEAAKAKKIDKVRLEEIVAALLDKGEIYEPELGMMKRI